VANDTLIVGGKGSHEADNADPDIADQKMQSQVVPSEATQQTSTEGPSMLIMTGPNYSGKSVYLKQVSLIVYMAHVGW